MTNCLTCQSVLPIKKVKRGFKYCGADCYHYAQAHRKKEREYSSEDFIKIEDYKHFLDNNRLPCLLKDCNWVGTSITLHMVLSHGLNKREIKQLGGFNLSSGLISPSLKKRFRQRDHFLKPGSNPKWRKHVNTLTKNKGKKCSMEGIQKLKEARASWIDVVEMNCHVCKKVLCQILAGL